MVKRLLHIPTASYWHIGSMSIKSITGLTDISNHTRLMSRIKSKFGDYVHLSDNKFVFSKQKHPDAFLLKEYEFEIVDCDD